MFESESDDHNKNNYNGEKQSGPTSPKNLQELKTQVKGVIQG